VQIIFWRSYAGITCADTGINFGPIYLGQNPLIAIKTLFDHCAKYCTVQQNKIGRKSAKSPDILLIQALKFIF